MAKLNSPAMELAAAVSAATLTTSRRLSRNFNYYRSNSLNEKCFSRDSLLSVCNNLRMDLFGLQNLFLDYAESPTPFMVTLAGDVHDSFENLHRNLLFYDAEHIESIIPKIDHERSYWSNFTNHHFYEKGISEHINTNTLPAISQIKQKLLAFPTRPKTGV
jgi:hypothetical protein